MKKRQLLQAMLATVLTATVGGLVAADNTDHAADLLKRIQDKQTITIGTEGTYPPFTYHDENGKLTGYDVEVTRAIADKLGVTVDFKETQWDAMLAGLNSHRFDAVANQVGLTSPERREKYDGTDNYSFSGAVVLARKDNDSIKQWADLKGLKAAQSFTSNYAEKARANGAEIVGVDGLAQSIQLLLQKRADVTINDSLAVLDFVKKHPDAPLNIVIRSTASEKVGTGLVFNKGNEKTITLFNQAITELRQDGTLKQLSEQFFGEDISKQ